MLAVLLVTACDSSAPDGNGLVIELVSSSASPNGDVILALHGRGGASIFVTVDPGSFRAADSLERDTSECLAGADSNGILTSDIAVTPADNGTLLSVGLFTSSDCSGDALQSRLLVVQRPTVVPATDAGIEDAP